MLEDFAIVIGIQHYPGWMGADGASSGLPILEGPDNDAQEIYDWLTSPSGGKVKKKNATLLRTADYNSEGPVSRRRPNVNDIDLAFRDLIESRSSTGSKIGRRLYVYISGHGFGVDAADYIALLPNSNDSMPYHIRLGTWKNYFENAGYFQEMIIISDACATPERSMRREIPSVGLYWSARRVDDRDDPCKILWIAAAAAGGGQQNTALERPIDADGGKVHGLLTYELLKAFKGQGPAIGDTLSTETLKGFLSKAYEKHLTPEQLADPKIAREPKFVVSDEFELVKFSREVLHKVSIDLPEAAIGRELVIEGGAEDISHAITSTTQVVSLPYGQYYARIDGLDGVQPVMVLGDDDVRTDQVPGGVARADGEIDNLAPEEFAFSPASQSANVPNFKALERRNDFAFDIEAGGAGGAAAEPAKRSAPSAHAESGHEKFHLEVDGGHPAAEIILLDHGLRAVERGIGKLRTRSQRGVYRAKVVLARSAIEEPIRLHQDVDLVFEAPRFSSPAPFTDSRISNADHTSACVRESSAFQLEIGSGSGLFFFARWWSDESGRPTVGELGHPFRGIILLRDDERLVDLAHTPEGSQGRDWAALNVQVDSGMYTLRRQVDDTTVVEQAIVAKDGWNTQVFVGQRLTSSYDSSFANTPSTQISEIAVLTARNGFPAGRDSDLELTEILRMALVDNRKVMSRRLRELIIERSENPMVGLFGAHLMIKALERSNPSNEGANNRWSTLEDTDDIDKDIGIVVRKVQQELGKDHPDVQCLSLRTASTKSEFSGTLVAPPMLEQSWKLIAQARTAGLVQVDAAVESELRELSPMSGFLAWNAK